MSNNVPVSSCPSGPVFPEAQRSARRRAIEQVLRRLPRKDLLVCLLAADEGLTLEEAAAALGWPADELREHYESVQGIVRDAVADAS